MAVVVKKIYTVPAVGVGRKDYSVANEFSVEPLISSWQSVYLHHEVVTVPAEGSTTTDVEIPLNQVVLLYDFFASIPSSLSIRLEVYSVDSEGTAVCVVDQNDLQTIQSHLSKGFPFFKTIRFVTYNYAGEEEDNMRIGCAGLYTSLDEYYAKTGSLPPLF